MTRDEAVALIQEGLGFTTQREDSIILRMKQTQRKLERGRTLPWFLKTLDATTTATSGSAAISLPANFNREVEREQFHFIDPNDPASVVWLEKMTLEEAVTRFVDTDAGVPSAYVIRDKSQVLVYPERDDDYDLTWSYYVNDEEIGNGGSENLWLTYAPDLIIGGAGTLMAQDLRDQRAEAKFQQIFNSSWAEMFSDGQAIEEDNDPLYIGGRL